MRLRLKPRNAAVRFTLDVDTIAIELADAPRERGAMWYGPKHAVAVVVIAAVNDDYGRYYQWAPGQIQVLNLTTEWVAVVDASL